MFVDTALLHSGATESHQAGEYAHDGANLLSRKPPAAGMFGDFHAAEAFHEAVTIAHGHHVTTLQAQQEVLSAVGDQAHHSAVGFTAMEDRNAKVLREVR